MRIAYSVRAVISPISITPAPIRLPPVHRIATIQILITKNAALSSPANRRFARTAVMAYSSNDFLIRFSSSLSLINARITRTPVRFSRNTTFIRSRSFWSIPNISDALRVTRTASTIIRTVIPIRRNPITASMANAMTIPIMHAAGTGRTIWIHHTTDCCIILMSFKVRVIIDPVPNCSKS